MPSSRAVRAAAFALAAALAIAGCAHAPRERPPATQAEPDHEPPAPPTRRTEFPEERPAAPAASPAPSGRLDPSEEITPEELATLPDPLGPETAPRAATGALAPPSGIHPSPGDSAAPAPSDGLWRVQIHASETRGEAERIGRAAARRLGVELFVQREGALYKVRLGAFATEAEAQALRDRAIRAGYPGAFRTRARP